MSTVLALIVLALVVAMWSAVRRGPGSEPASPPLPVAPIPAPPPLPHGPVTVDFGWQDTGPLPSS